VFNVTANRRLWCRCLAALCLLLGVSGAAAAQGFGIYEQGACAMSRAGAAVAAPCKDGSAIFFNPAAIVLDGNGSHLSAGGTLIGPRGDFTSFDGRASGVMKKNWLPVPTAYYTRWLSERLTAGVGAFVPFGLTTEWPTDFAGRFASYRTSLDSFYVQPTLAYKVNDHLAVGGGADLAFSTLQLKQRIDLATRPLSAGLTFAQIGVPPGTDFANLDISGWDFGIAEHFGVLVTANEKLSLGARYLTRLRIQARNLKLESAQIPTGLRTPVALPGLPAGTPIDTVLAPQFSGNGPLTNQDATIEFVVPDEFVAGVAVKPAEHLTLLADYQFTRWSLFDRLQLSTERGLEETLVKNFRDTSGVRAGVDYGVTDSVVVRGGVVAHQAAAPDGSVTPDLPEGARVEYTAGVGVRVNPRFAVDLAYQYIGQEDRNGRVLPTGPDTGIYTFHANLFGATLVMGF